MARPLRLEFAGATYHVNGPEKSGTTSLSEAVTPTMAPMVPTIFVNAGTCILSFTDLIGIVLCPELVSQRF
jgi:hypothetical protein